MQEFSALRVNFYSVQDDAGDSGVIALDGGDRSGYLPWMTSRYFPREVVEGRLELGASCMPHPARGGLGALQR